MIVDNAFMKREYGKSLVENFFTHVDLTHVINTDGAYLPGHGTPTAILLGRDRSPVRETIRTVVANKGEPGTPENPALGLVWQAIVNQVDIPGSESKFVTVADMMRETLRAHPWSIGGGGAIQLKEAIESRATISLLGIVDEVGVLGMTNADEIMIADTASFGRRGVERSVVSPLLLGDSARDWLAIAGDSVVFPYRDSELVSLNEYPMLGRWLWPARTTLGNRATFSKLTYFEEGRPWWGP